MKNEYTGQTVDSLEQLKELYGPIAEASVKKEIAYLHPHYQTMIKASPFAVLATSGLEGLDASPRGDHAGFVAILNDKTLALPDRRGNNRIDSLRNIIQDPRVALLFLIPGVGETLRVNGKAKISIAQDLLNQFSVNDKKPKCVIIIEVEQVFFQCSRAIHRANLWGSSPTTETVPSPGKILSALTQEQFDGEKYDNELPDRIKTTLY